MKSACRRPSHDPFSHLNLAAGRHLVTGNEALAFVRTRHGVGNGGDLGRIQLQQEFMSSLIQKIESSGVLANPVKLLSIANTATGALTVDPGLGSVARLLTMAGRPPQPAQQERDVHHHAHDRGPG